MFGGGSGDLLGGSNMWRCMLREDCEGGTDLTWEMRT